MPDTPFRDAIDEGRIIVAADSGRLLGYLMYRIRKSSNDIAVVHVATEREERRGGVASALVSKLIQASFGRSRIVLRCRRDYPAHSFWPRCGFEAIAEQEGRSADGHILTFFEYRLTQEPTIFDTLYESSQPFAVDLDVLLDLATNRPQGWRTREIFLLLDQVDVHPVRTTALSNELISHKIAAVRKRAQELIAMWPPARLHATESQRSDLATRVPGLGSGDLSQLADAEANDVPVLLTRDVDFQAVVASAPSPGTAVRAIEPATFADMLLRDEDTDYRPGTLGDLNVSAASDHDLGQLVDMFLCEPCGERKTEFREVLRGAFASPQWTVSCLVSRGEPACLLSMRSGGAGVEIDLFRVVGSKAGKTLARHALAFARRVASRSGGSWVEVTDPSLRDDVLRALRAEGFSRTRRGWAAVALPGAQQRNVVRQTISSLSVMPHLAGIAANITTIVERADTDKRAAADVERLLDPLVVIDSPIPSVLVPIRAHWSDRLVGTSPSQLPLVTLDEELNLYREHVYFRSPISFGVDAPMRIFWYRTGERPSRVFATSILDQLVVADVNEIWGRFNAYGVLTRRDVVDRQKGERVMAMPFKRTHRLSREFTLDELQSYAESIGASNPAVPVAPRRIDDHVAAWMLQSGMEAE